MRSASGSKWWEPVAHLVGQVAPDRFCFLNAEHSLSDHGWDDPSLDKLWRYNLHYFDDLTAPSSVERVHWQQALLRRWVAENPPAKGSGWEPYPTSLRIVNWIKWALAGNQLPPECVQSLAVQTRWLSRRLERHLLGNHLFANAKALVFAGAFFEGVEADRWCDGGLQILAREVPEQILADGGQFERSPMYHALALEDMLDLENIAAKFSGELRSRWQTTIAAWPQRIEQMRHWLRVMSHPDGEISFFNDAALGIAPSPTALEQYAERLGLGAQSAALDAVTALESSGYLRIDDRSAVAVLDLAPVGPDYLPAHAHADTLSFELSLYGQRVVVNSGTSCYGNSAERLRQRGTAAHNTVVVDGENSTEVWGGFRVARRARPFARSVEGNGKIVVRCAHDGYGRLPGRPQHFRQWTFSDCALTVEDRVTGNFRNAEARFHLHPLVSVEQTSGDAGRGRTVILRLPEGQVVRLGIEVGRFRTEDTTWHFEFGRSVPNECLVVELDDALSRIHLEWDQPA